MMNSLRITTAALAPALALTLLLPTAASASSQEAGPASCSVEGAAEQPNKKKKGLSLGGLLGAAKRVGIGNILDSLPLGDSKAPQVVEVVAGTAIEGGDTASAVAGAAGSNRIAQAAGAVVGVAAELARQAPSRCGGAN